MNKIFKPDRPDTELEGRALNEIIIARFPIFLWVILVYAGSMILQLLSKFYVVNTLFFTILIILHVTLHWNLHRIKTARAWLYFVVQGMLILTCALVMPYSSPAVLIGLFPVLVGESIGLYYRKRNIIFVLMYCLAMFIYTIIYLNDYYDLVLLVPLFFLMLIIVVAYASLFFQQVHARIRTQTFLKDLEKAHKKVEELTLANERQRLARDLHDTLAQGLAGIIMQLEAVNAHISKGNLERSQEYLGISMKQARRILAEARLAIDNLRVKSASNIGFKDALKDEAQRFIQATSIDLIYKIEIHTPLMGALKEHTLQIVSECLMNIAKHAQADKVWVNVREQSRFVELEIIDNGIGFDTNIIGTKMGHYGILGMYERVRLIGGNLDIRSRSTGTTIRIEIPIQRVNNDEII
ncbi:Sensor histidine kinase LiaS [compost metagenome]